MRKSRITLTVVALILHACGGDSTAPPVPTTVEVSPDIITVDAVGDTVRFTATVLDQDGNTISGQSVTWSSLGPEVATIDASSGLATAVGQGSATIQASAGGVTGTAVFRVCDSPTLDLSPGEMIALDATEGGGCGFFLPSGSAGDRYRFAVIRPVSDEDVTNTLAVTVTTMAVGVTSPPAVPALAPPRASGELPADLMRAVAVADATSSFHAEMRARERRMLREMGASLQPLPDRSSDVAFLGPLRAPAPDKRVFDTNTDGCSSSSSGPTATGIKILEDDRFVVYQDSTVHATAPVSSSNVQMMLDFYRDYGESIIDDYFDGISDVNGDGLVEVFITPIVEGDVAAFVWSGDFFDKADCDESNEAELIYFSRDLIDDIDDGRYTALPTLVHEVKHVSSLYKSVRRWYVSSGADAYHPDWVEEGVAEIAGEMASRSAWATLNGGPAVGEMADRDHKLATGVVKENYGILTRWARTMFYLLSQPNGVVVTPDGADDDHTIYGSGWHFHRWLGDAYGNASTAYADAGFFRAQNDSLSASGVQGIQDLTGRSWRQLMEEYAAAVMFNGTGAPQPTRAFTTYDFVSGLTELLVPQSQPDGFYPWPVNLSGSATSSPFTSGTYSGPIGASGLRIHDFTSNGTGVGMEVLVALAGGRVVVVRLN